MCCATRCLVAAGYSLLRRSSRSTWPAVVSRLCGRRENRADIFGGFSWSPFFLDGQRKASKNGLRHPLILRRSRWARRIDGLGGRFFERPCRLKILPLTLRSVSFVFNSLFQNGSLVFAGTLRDNGCSRWRRSCGSWHNHNFHNQIKSFWLALKRGGRYAVYVSRLSASRASKLEIGRNLATVFVLFCFRPHCSQSPIFCKENRQPTLKNKSQKQG